MAGSDDSLGCLGILALALGGFFLFSDNSWSNAIWYAAQYGVHVNDVQTDAKPNDCDFMHAPLGDKGCSYKAHVMVYNADGVLVAGENAPKYGTDTKTAKPIISHDGGKNWDWWYGGTSVPNPKPKSVRVFWVKK